MRSTRIGLVAALLLLPACSEGGDHEIRGTVELPEVDVSPLTTARVVRVAVEEGDRVAPGDTLAVLTVSDADAQLGTMRARVAAARSAAADLRAGARAPELASARADLEAASAEADRTARERDRARVLLEAGASAQQEFDRADAAATVAEERRSAAAEALRLLEAGARTDQVRAAEAEVRRAEADLAATEARLGDLVLTAPVGGVVLVRHAEPGERVAAGMAAVTLADTARTWVKAWVPQRLLDGLTPGTTMQVTPDGWSRSVEARVVSVAPEAEYVPRVALTEEERADQLFAVRLAPAEPLPGGVWVRVAMNGLAQ